MLIGSLKAQFECNNAQWLSFLQKNCLFAALLWYSRIWPYLMVEPALILVESRNKKERNLLVQFGAKRLMHVQTYYLDMFNFLVQPTQEEKAYFWWWKGISRFRPVLMRLQIVVQFICNTKADHNYTWMHDHAGTQNKNWGCFTPSHNHSVTVLNHDLA